MKIITYNVNGIRSAVSKGLLDWLKAASPDVLFLQELKADLSGIPITQFEDLGYHCHWHPAEKKGYSGVAVLTKFKPEHVEQGCGNELIDREGRILRVDYQGHSFMSLYQPSGSSGEDRQDFKFEFMDFFYGYMQSLKQEKPKLIIGGDFNICHKPIDIHNPKSNAKSSGFLPEEREWMEGFMNSGFTDTFRRFNADPHHYTWWSYRFNSRAKNLGWRIDYHLSTHPLDSSLSRAIILPEAMHSDHCPLVVEVDF
jgi:exodeoxyribonuclease-3